MSETDQILMNTAARLFDDLITPTVLRDADAGGWPAEVWQAIEDVGLPLALVPEDHGGFGVSPQAALAVVRAAAHGAAPVPCPKLCLLIGFWLWREWRHRLVRLPSRRWARTIVSPCLGPQPVCACQGRPHASRGGVMLPPLSSSPIATGGRMSFWQPPPM